MYAKLATFLRILLTIAAVAYCGQAVARSLPLITDDPETPGAGGWQLNFASNLEHNRDGDQVEAPLLEFNHGFTDHDEFRVEFSVLTDDPGDENKTSGISDLLVGYKYRFLEEKECGWAVSFFPQVSSPTGNEDRDLGSGQSELLIPFEFSKHFCCEKAWINYEVGYNTVFGDHDENSWKLGLSMGRELPSKLELLGEVGAFIFQGDEEPDNPFFNLGFKYPLNKNLKLMGSAGRSFRSREDGTPDFFCLLGLQVLLGRAAKEENCCAEEPCGYGVEDSEEELHKPQDSPSPANKEEQLPPQTTKSNGQATEELILPAPAP